ncbi:exopolysaccharide biosynthesis polyprenyl glycosylphosphotransferase, partial [bacterium]|nr:exopolysaccharide biosynthesis polyprenyl glycosylphosphotransferase [bacterium]
LGHTKAEACCIIGAGEQAQIVLERLLFYRSKEYAYKGSIYKQEPTTLLFSIQKEHKQFASSVDISTVDKLFKKHKIKHVFFTNSSYSATQIKLFKKYCYEHNIQYYFYNEISQSTQGITETKELDGVSLITVKKNKKNKLYDYTKRLFDVLAAVVLLILLHPVLILIALWIKAVSPRGAIVFSQERTGINQSIFKIYKFRTMVMNAEEKTGPIWVEEGDSRYIYGGKWLRRTSLDELPQLINILKNEMSIIGPRPERPFFVEKISKTVPHFHHRHQIKGGITGWAQIHGRAFLTNKPQEKCRYDLYYITNISLLLDVKILIKTLVIVIKGEQAY